VVHALLERSEKAKALAIARKAQALAPKAKPARQAVFFALQAQAKEKVDAKACDDVDAIAVEMDALQDVLEGQPWSSHTMRGACWAQRGNVEYDAQRWDQAAHAYRRALGHLPSEKALGQNLARVDYSRAIALGKLGKCDDARAILARAVEGDTSLAADRLTALESCHNGRAVDAANKSDWARAVAELRRGLADVPKSEVMQKNLAAMLGNLAREHLKAKRCDDARELVPELKAAGRADVVENVEQRCQ
jgi:tetratricopeptide (TPR) repeat protein